MSSAISGRTRSVTLDRTRGLAIVLMIADHALVLVDPTHPARYTVTRFALPLFMLCTASTLRRARARTRRLVQVAAVGTGITVLTTIAWPAFGAQPDVTLLIVLAIVATERARASWYGPALVATGALVQALYLPIGWNAYEPGLVIAWLCIARYALAEQPDLTHRIGTRLPAVFAVPGRYPLTAYASHVTVLASVAALGGDSWAR